MPRVACNWVLAGVLVRLRETIQRVTPTASKVPICTSRQVSPEEVGGEKTFKHRAPSFKWCASGCVDVLINLAAQANRTAALVATVEDARAGADGFLDEHACSMERNRSLSRVSLFHA